MATIEGEGVDQVPLNPPFQGFWALGIANISVPLSLKKPRLGAEAQIKAAEKFGFDGLETTGDFLMPPVEALGCEVKQPDVGAGSTWTPIIIEPGDLDKLEVPDLRLDHRLMSHTIATEYVLEKEGKNKFVQFSTIAPFTLVGDIRGVEAVMLDTLTDPKFVVEMLRFGNEVMKAYVEYMIKLGVDGITLCDPTASGSLISPGDFEKYSKPYIEDCAKVIKKHDGVFILHICGDTSDRLDNILDTNPDVFSIDYQVDLSIAKKAFGNKSTLLGNVKPAHTLYSGTADTTLKECLDCIKKGSDSRYILGAGCDIAPGTPEENVMQMSKAVQMAKKASIRTDCAN
jgi:uroporphyrinogen decarboxylase